MRFKPPKRAEVQRPAPVQRLRAPARDDVPPPAGGSGFRAPTRGQIVPRNPVQRFSPPTKPNATSTSIDPIAEYKFHVSLEVNGIIEALFTECSGITLEREVEKYPEGGLNEYYQVLSGRTKQSTITLKRGLSLSTNLWDWFQAGTINGKVTRVNVTIIIYDAWRSKEALRWNLLDAFPVKWSGPTFKSDSTQSAIESIELAFHGIELVRGRQK